MIKFYFEVISHQQKPHRNNRDASERRRPASRPRPTSSRCRERGQEGAPHGATTRPSSPRGRGRPRLPRPSGPRPCREPRTSHWASPSRDGSASVPGTASVSVLAVQRVGHRPDAGAGPRPAGRWPRKRASPGRDDSSQLPVTLGVRGHRERKGCLPRTGRPQDAPVTDRVLGGGRVSSATGSAAAPGGPGPRLAAQPFSGTGVETLALPWPDPHLTSPTARCGESLQATLRVETAPRYLATTSTLSRGVVGVGMPRSPRGGRLSPAG